MNSTCLIFAPTTASMFGCTGPATVSNSQVHGLPFVPTALTPPSPTPRARVAQAHAAGSGLIIGSTADIRVVNGPDGFNGSPVERQLQIREPLKKPEKGGALLSKLWSDKIYVRVCLA